MTATIKLIPESYPGASLVFELGSVPPLPGDDTGIATYNKIARPRRRSIYEFAGEDPVEITFSIIMDQWSEDGDLIEPFNRVWGWAAKNSLPTMPTIIRTEGPVPFSYLRWIILKIKVVEQRQRESDWALSYFELQLTLGEWNDIDLIVQSNAAAASPAAAATARAVAATTVDPAISENPKLAIAYGVDYTGSAGSGQQQRTYTVKKGDTLSSIAAHQLGKSSRWTEIAGLNGLRDPNRINVGQVLRLPSS
jgi:LysM repeat protein